MTTLETDYLVIGSGAMGMAFVDTLLEETDAQIIMVDRYGKPGGHWNHAYPFVSLHQPSQFYGVSSRELSKGRIDKTGLNKGLSDLASGAEVSAYFDEVMRDHFLPSGRVQYFPLHDYKGEHSFSSILTGKAYRVKVNRKVIDCTYLNTSVPATHTPSFSVEEGVPFMPLNDLPKLKESPEGFVVIGGGKTGIDACLWLLENQVEPDKITWIVSRDAWLIDRKNTQPTEDFFEQTFNNQAAQMEAIAQADSVENMFDRLEAAGVFVRLDKSVRPKMFHGATVSEMELEELRKIKQVIRMGRVSHISQDFIELDQGKIPTSNRHIHVDCSASAIPNLEIKPIFQGDLITPQTVRAYQPVFSASVVAYVEANYEDDKKKNELCQVVQLPNHDVDWIPMTAAQMQNQFTWSQDKPLRRWVRNNRLDGFGKLVAGIDRHDEKKMSILKRMRDSAFPAIMKLQQFMKELDKSEQASLENPQLQVKKKAFFQNRLVEMDESALSLEEGEILLKVDQFAYTANNITYAVAGDMIGYWQFFPPQGNDKDGWGVIPVWGFAEVTESRHGAIPVGERLFGYFPPARFLKMLPDRISEQRFLDASEHRSKLPAGYNYYTRVQHEKGYNPAFDRERMLLTPLHLTSFCLWDALQDKDWYGAEQILVLSASSKTSIGLGYALEADEKAPQTIGLTSARNLEMVKGLEIYDESISYDAVESLDLTKATVIVDMSGNSSLLVKLHSLLGDQMKFTINVGLTHWTDALPQKGIIKERSEFFFAPGHIQKRMKEWGPAGFEAKTSSFMRETAAKTKEWLTFKEIDGLEELAKIHPAVCEGKIPPSEGLIVKLK